MIRALLSSLVSLAATVIIMPIVIKLSVKFKASQTILNYVDNHSGKNGTPTMGGIGFILAVSLTAPLFLKGESALFLITLLVTVGYGIIGFLDDFIKIYYKRNKGLSVAQKLVFQMLMAIVVSLFAYYNSFVGSRVLLPFSVEDADLGAFAVPLYVLVFLAFTNSVNLTDGLDGLAAKTSAVFSIFSAAIIFVLVCFGKPSEGMRAEYENLSVYCGALAGALIGFLCYNGFPAKIFMGDTGALALGGGLAALTVMTRTVLFSPMLGIVYVLTSISVIVQVTYFKLSGGKRVFLMAPVHHHFERMGFHENKIASAYAAVTFAAGVLLLAAMLAATNF